MRNSTIFGTNMASKSNSRQRSANRDADSEIYSVLEDTGTGSNVPAFLMKLWTLVEDPSNDDIICWDPSGKTFHIYDTFRFAHEVLPFYFKHNNISSFIRQLNMYGFRKQTHPDQGGLKVERDDLEFGHPFFQQGQEQLLDMIKRKAAPVKAERGGMHVNTDQVSKVLSDVTQLKGKQDNISTSLDQLKRENEALWREVASLRQKHAKQQQIVNKLIQFLLSLVGGRRGMPGLKRKMPLMIRDSAAAENSGASPTKSARVADNSADHTYTIESQEFNDKNTDTALCAHSSPGSFPELLSPPSSGPLLSSSSSGPIIHEVSDLPEVNSSTDILTAASNLNANNITTPPTVSSPSVVTAATVTQPNMASGLLGQAMASANILPDLTLTTATTNNRKVSTPSVAQPPPAQSLLQPSQMQVQLQQPQQQPLQQLQVLLQQQQQEQQRQLPPQQPSPQKVLSSPQKIPPQGVPPQMTAVQQLLANQQQTQTQPEKKHQAEEQKGLTSQEVALRSQDKPLSSTSKHLYSPREVNEQLDILQSDLDSLKDVLSTGQYSIDPSFLSGLFDPEHSLPLNLDSNNIDSIDTYGKAQAFLDNLLTETPTTTSGSGSTSGNVAGNELLQYQPPDLLPDLFDLGVVDSPDTPENEEELPVYFTGKEGGLQTPKSTPSGAGLSHQDPGAGLSINAEELD